MAHGPNANIRKLEWERENNKYSKFYPQSPRNLRIKRETDTDIQDELSNYTHIDGIQFAAETWFWEKNTEKVKELPRNKTKFIPTSSSVKGIRAYYRVLVEQKNKYILIACHVNMHGFHRGDLRFVEVNDRTVLERMKDTSVIGRLFPGDVVAVTRLRKKSKTVKTTTSVFNVEPDTNCTWEVQNMTLLTREKVDRNVNFAILENGMAVVQGRGEVMNVMEDTKNQPLKVDKIYTGSAFIPEKMKIDFTEDFPKKYKERLIALTSNIPSYSNSLGTIYSYSFCPTQTRLFEIGVKAFDTAENGEEADEVVEKCVMMGASAAQTVSKGRFDGRGFPIKHAIREGLILHFSISNPVIQPTERRWSVNNRIELEGRVKSRFELEESKRYDAIIETVVLATNRKTIRIAARLPKNVANNVNFGAGIWIVHQRQMPEYLRFEPGFFKKIPENENGRKVIKTLYGGPKIDITDYSVKKDTFIFPSEPGVNLNGYQNDYVSMIIAGVPLVLGNSPFGCGKSMTIVTAAIEVHKHNRRFNKHGKQRQQLLITQTNNACVNLIEIARKVREEVDVKFVRFVNESNWKTLPEASRTIFDMPVLMRKVFLDWVSLTQVNRIDKVLAYDLKKAIVRKVIQSYMDPVNLVGEAKIIYENLSTLERTNEPSPRQLREAFFLLYEPDVIVTTADSLPGLLNANCLKYIGNLQIDEASQLPEHTLIYLLQLFPQAGFGLVGDIKQLLPYCDEVLVGRMKEYGIGNTMERATQNKMFPQSVLRYVYRCHPVTTTLLSDLFYESRLISGIEETDRNQFMRMRPDVWPNQKFPIIVLNHEKKGYRMGTSVANESEKLYVLRIVKSLTKEVNGYQLSDSDIGVISFYRAQASLLTEAFRGTNVKCGTVDAFQGTEREVMILCCTNDKPSDFMKCPNRFNVAMSRAKQATIIIGNVQELRDAIYWRTIIEKARQNDCLIEDISNFGNNDDSNHIVPGRCYGTGYGCDDDPDNGPDGNRKAVIDGKKNRRCATRGFQHRGRATKKPDDKKHGSIGPDGVAIHHPKSNNRRHSPQKCNLKQQDRQCRQPQENSQRRENLNRRQRVQKRRQKEQQNGIIENDQTENLPVVGENCGIKKNRLSNNRRDVLGKQREREKQNQFSTRNEENPENGQPSEAQENLKKKNNRPNGRHRKRQRQEKEKQQQRTETENLPVTGKISEEKSNRLIKNRLDALRQKKERVKQNQFPTRNEESPENGRPSEAQENPKKKKNRPNGRQRKRQRQEREKQPKLADNPTPPFSGKKGLENSNSISNRVDPNVLSDLMANVKISVVVPHNSPSDNM